MPVYQEPIVGFFKHVPTEKEKAQALATFAALFRAVCEEPKPTDTPKETA